MPRLIVGGIDSGSSCGDTSPCSSASPKPRIVAGSPSTCLSSHSRGVARRERRRDEDEAQHWYALIAVASYALIAVASSASNATQSSAAVDRRLRPGGGFMIQRSAAAADEMPSEFRHLGENRGLFCERGCTAVVQRALPKRCIQPKKKQAVTPSPFCAAGLLGTYSRAQRLLSVLSKSQKMSSLLGARPGEAPSASSPVHLGTSP